MNSKPEKPGPVPGASPRQPYIRPELKRVELALAETLSTGCKLDTDPACVGPPITAYNGGS